MARSLLVLTAVLGLSICLRLTQAEVTYEEAVDAFHGFTDNALQLENDANKITLVDAVLIEANQGGFVPVIDDINLLSSTLTNHSQQFQDTVFGSCNGLDSVANAFYDFTDTLNAALKALEDKAGAFTIAPAVGSSVANPLRGLNGDFDRFVRDAASLCPDSAAAFLNTGKTTDEQFDTVINTYSGGAVTTEILGGGFPTIGGLLGGGGRRLLRI